MRITRPMLQLALSGAMPDSFNNLTVDDDMSTNDAVFALANGLARNPPISDPGPTTTSSARRCSRFCVELAREIAADGEGATKLLEVTVSAPDRIADDLAKSVAGSTLVKAAVFGCDPNWGRVLATVGARAGSQGYAIDPAQRGSRSRTSASTTRSRRSTIPGRLKARMREPQVQIEVDLRAGKARRPRGAAT